MKLDINSIVKLNNDVEIPIFGLGTYLASEGQQAVNAINYALEAGYRHFDTAAFYFNEESVGKALRDSGYDRKELFVTTKLWNSDHGYDKALKAFDKSFKKLNLEYIDLYLIHWPVENLRNETWKALEKVYDEGLVKAIGVSNYTIRHIEELLGICEIPPTVNQVEYHPFLYQKELRDYCRSKEIVLESYSPLTKGNRINDENLAVIAKEYNRSPAQILIRWNLEQEVVVIPKSSNKERIIENASVFDFSIKPEDMERLNALNENYRCTWDPSNIK
jgi:diketogulonate reductase-like aldo/keto reductase